MDELIQRLGNYLLVIICSAALIRMSQCKIQVMGATLLFARCCQYYVLAISHAFIFFCDVILFGMQTEIISTTNAFDEGHLCQFSFIPLMTKWGNDNFSNGNSTCIRSPCMSYRIQVLYVLVILINGLGYINCNELTAVELGF